MFIMYKKLKLKKELLRKEEEELYKKYNIKKKIIEPNYKISHISNCESIDTISYASSTDYSEESESIDINSVYNEGYKLGFNDGCYKGFNEGYHKSYCDTFGHTMPYSMTYPVYQ